MSIDLGMVRPRPLSLLHGKASNVLGIPVPVLPPKEHPLGLFPSSHSIPRSSTGVHEYTKILRVASSARGTCGQTRSLQRLAQVAKAIPASPPTLLQAKAPLQSGAVFEIAEGATVHMSCCKDTPGQQQQILASS